MGLPDLELSPAAWTLITLAAVLATAVGKAGLGVLRAYYILRVRAGLPVVMWFPKFWRIDSRRQTGSSLSRVLKRMELLKGPHGMYGTVFGTQAVLHVADPEAAALVLSQHTKRPGYDHFGGFFGRGVFTADGEEWRRKRATVAHALFRGGRGSSSTADVVGGVRVAHGGGGGGGGGKGLAVLANEEADSLLREVEALREGGEGEEVEVEVVRLLQRHTLNLIHRFLCGGEDVCASPERRRLLPRYLDAVTDMRMVILARSRSVWMFAWGWAYRAFSPLHAREARNMGPIRDFAELVLGSAVEVGGSSQAGARNGSGASWETAGTSGGDSSSSGSSVNVSENRGEGVHPGLAASPPRAGEGGEERRPPGTASVGTGAGGVAGKAAAAAAAGPRSALFKMAARESHRAYPGSMVDETITLLFAGQDTSAATLSWTMHLLSLPENRHYLAEVRREVLEAVGPGGYVDCGGSSSSSSSSTAANKDGQKHQSRPQLPMVDACIRESQRLYPVAPFVVRHLTSDLRLKDGTLLPAGALACVWIYGLHRHPALWESPDAFLPERWLSGARQPPGAFVPYASGPRGCVGRPFAGVVLRILLARICAALDFSPAAAGAADTSATDLPPKEAAAAAVGAERGTAASKSGTQPQRGFDGTEGAASGVAGSGGKPTRGGACREPGRGATVGAGGGSGASSKEMQAGFTVLPGGGVQLRLRKWKD